MHTVRVLGVSLVGLALTACATHQTARLEARDTLANAHALAMNTNAPSVVGKTEMNYRDRWTAANLFERAVDGRDSVGNRFNLATSYAATGRLQQAAAIYRDLVTEGQYTYALSSRDAYNRHAPVRRFNIADESARRLQDIAIVTAAQSVSPANGVLAASEFGVPTAAIAGGPSSGSISDAEAMRRDGF